jgi:diguanylate cyclase (GGDEF)-like protein
MLTPVVLLIITALANLLMLGVLGSLMRSGIAGVRECMWASGLVFVSLLTFAVQPALPAFVGIVVANLLMAMGMALFFVSVLRFFNRPVPCAVLAAAVAAQSIGVILFWYVWRDTSARIIVVSVLHGALAGGVAVTIMRNRPFHRPAYPYFFAIGVAVFSCLGHTLRAGVYLLGIEVTQSIHEGTPLHLAFLSVGVMVIPSLTLGMIIMVHDRMLADRESEANTDFLTGMLSRKAWWQAAEKVVARAMRNDQRLSLLMLDIDRFKHINDTYGHLLGDAVLQHFGALAPMVLRTEDILGRVGGEEFAVLFPDTRIDAAAFATNRLLDAVRSNSCTYGNWSIGYTFSGGLVEWDGQESAQMLTQRADRALYAAKDAGRNRIIRQT